MIDVTMPQLGETVTEGTIIRWCKNVGDAIAADEVLFEVSTDKIDSEVPSPAAGTVAEILAAEGDVVEVGQVLCRVSSPAVAAGEPSAPAGQAPSSPARSQAPAQSHEEAPTGSAGETPSAAASSLLPPPQRQPETSTAAAGGPLLSPVVRRLIADSGLDISGIEGSGLGGRVTRLDVERAIHALGHAAQPAPVPGESAGAQAARSAAFASKSPARASGPPARKAGPGDEVVALNNIRRRTAEHMVASKAASPHVLTAMEVDYEGVEQVRRRHSEAWKSSEGFSLTYLPFIVRAVADALREFPHLNASFGGDHLVVHDHLNLAVAVDIDFEGLLAPVIKGADGKRLRQIARDIVDLAARARTRQLTPDDLTGGTFTVTNAGSYGTMMQFPIINQPQVAILSTDGVKRKPVVVTDDFGNESIAIHSVGVLALAWDHRAFDGAYAAAFLNKVTETIETRDWMSEVG